MKKLINLNALTSNCGHNKISNLFAGRYQNVIVLDPSKTTPLILPEQLLLMLSEYTPLILLGQPLWSFRNNSPRSFRNNPLQPLGTNSLNPLELPPWFFRNNTLYPSGTTPFILPEQHLLIIPEQLPWSFQNNPSSFLLFISISLFLSLAFRGNCCAVVPRWSLTSNSL